MRTSVSHPLQIAEVCPGDPNGIIGVTLCLGKKQTAAMTGSWDRDLSLDLDAVEAWNAAAVLTLMEPHELERLKVSQLGDEVRARNIDWYHLPIPDRHIPGSDFEVAWRQVGEGLRARLRSEFRILVHCMGGLGRAGTIAARLLVELGWGAAEAVEEVRRVRPGAIETQRQMDFVYNCRAVAEQKPDCSFEAIKDRAVGALTGLAVGDALGTTLEFSKRDHRARVTGMEGGGPFRLKAGEWTDDTSMALALADSLLRCDSVDERDLITRFVSWRDQGEYSSIGRCFDIGMTVSGALRRFEATGNPVAGSTDPNSAGNGSLMRLSPVAIRYWNSPEPLRDAAARQSRTTHGAPEAVDACIVFSDILADAISGRVRSEVLRPRPGDWAGAISAIASGSWGGQARNSIKSSGYVADSLEAALWCVGRTASFEEAVVLAANLAGDADTVAAITGQLAGALYGHANIPALWRQQIVQCGRIEQCASDLFDRSIGNPASA